GTGTIEAGAALIRTIHLYYRGEIGGCDRWARRAAALESSRPLWYSMALIGIAGAHYWRGDEKAAAALERTASLAQVSGKILSAVWALEFRALVAAQQSDPDAAERFTAQALRLAAEHTLEEHWVNGAAHLALAHAHELHGDQSAALTEAERALEFVRRGPGRLELALALITLARLRPEGAAASLAEAGKVIDSCPDPGFLRADGVRTPRRRTASRGDELSDREVDVLRLKP